MSDDTKVKVVGLTKKFGDLLVLNDISFNVKKGDLRYRQCEERKRTSVHDHLKYNQRKRRLLCRESGCLPQHDNYRRNVEKSGGYDR